MSLDNERKLLVDANLIGVTKKRWIILFALFLLSAASMYSSVCFGLVDDVFAAYFGITYQEADWITLAVYAISCIAIPIFAWLSFVNRMGVRMLLIVESSTLTLSYLCIVMAVAYPAVYWFIIVGQLIHGISNIIQWSVPPIFAVVWFPNNEIGFAIAANFVGAAVGATLGFILPSHTLRKPERVFGSNLIARFRNTTSVQETSPNNYLSPLINTWQLYDKDILLKIFVTLFIVSAFLTTFFFVWLTDVPEKAPTIAQALKRATSKTVLKLNAKNVQDFFILLKNILSDRVYLLLVFVYSIVHRAVMIEFTLMGDIMRAISEDIGFPVPDDALASYVLIFYPAFAATGSISAGYILSKYSAYRTQATIGAGMTFFFTAVLAISYHFRFFPGICICNGGFGFSTRICIIAMLSVVTRHTYPIDESFVSIWMTGFENIVLIAITEVGRLLISKVSPISALIFMTSFLFVAFLLMLVTKPKDKRLETENKTKLQENLTISKYGSYSQEKSD